MAPHRLDLYRLAVQHPQAEVRFLLRAWAAGANASASCALLREDFAGTAAVAAAWVALHPHHQAMAVELHRPTLAWASRRAALELGQRAGDLHWVAGDVMTTSGPRVDVLAALNFSILIYHQRRALLSYLRHARRQLRPGGVLVFDVYGGPSAMRQGQQTRHVTPDPHEGIEPFDYFWEQRACDALSARVDCRIHFRLPGPPPRLIANAFRYDWRLWTLPELLEVMEEAGFSRTRVWCDSIDSPGRYRPLRRMPAREDWVAYVVGRR